MTFNSRPLKGFRFSLIGPGKVGSSLASWMKASGSELAQVVGRVESSSASALAGRLGGRVGTLETLPRDEVDLLLLAVPDHLLEDLAKSLAGKTSCAVALHTAGSVGASVLEPLRPAASVGSLHPLKAFARAQPDPEAARGSFFALDGDPNAVQLGGRLAALWGAKAGVVAEDVRDLYHLAARLAAGGVTTLLSVAAEIAARLELPEDVANGYLDLARGALESAGRAHHPGDAITGPIARGDVRTVLRQLREIDARAPELRSVVTALDLETLRQLENRRGPDEARKRLEHALTGAAEPEIHRPGARQSRKPQR